MAKVTSKKIAKKSTAKKSAAKPTAVKKKAAVKAAKKPVTSKKKPVAKKTDARKPVAKKVMPKKSAAPAKVSKAPVKPVSAKPQMPASLAPKQHGKVQPVFPQQSAKEQKALYKVGNYVVYPTHGVGKIMAEETQMIGDIELRLLVINFEKDKMTLRVPMNRAAAAGLRPISGSDKMKEVYLTLKAKAKVSRGMWSRRAQEYETKINSGNIILISEVVRDLHQNVDQSERSYSERMIYENALNRLMGEVAAAEGTDTKTAYEKLMKLLRAKVAAAAAMKEAA